MCWLPSDNQTWQLKIPSRNGTSMGKSLISKDSCSMRNVRFPTGYLVVNYPRIVSGLVHPSFFSGRLAPTYPIYNQGCNPPPSTFFWFCCGQYPVYCTLETATTTTAGWLAANWSSRQGFSLTRILSHMFCKLPQNQLVLTCWLWKDGHPFRLLRMACKQLSHGQNCRQLILVFGGIYSLKNWMASHARKLFTSFAQAHVRASFAQARNQVDTLKTNTWIYNKKGYTTWWARVSNVVQGISRKVRASFAQAKGFLPTICPTETRSNMIVDSPYLTIFATIRGTISKTTGQAEKSRSQKKPRKKPMSGESEKQRCPRPKSASRLHRASKSSPNLRNLSSRKLAQAQFEKLTARKLPLWSRKDGARISRKDE